MSHVSLGEYYVEMKNYDEAIRIFTETVKMKQGSGKAYLYAYYTRGLCYLEKEQYDQAIKDFKDALVWDANHVLSNEQLGIAYFKKDELCLAYKRFKHTLQLDSHNREREAKEAPLYLAKITKNPCNQGQ